ncbi:MAG TPA: hypothetical protein VFQ51_20290 [Vicinamibacteria bacterium]|nr:hypothetical protein [Vicinamibacteria bacterium]
MRRHATTILIAMVLAGTGSTCRREPPQDMPHEVAEAPASADALFVYVRIPAAIAPIERGERFEDPLNSALRQAHLGEVTGGGTGLSAPDAQGRHGIEYCGIDVDLYDPVKGIPFLREELARLNVPRGTVLEYELGGRSQQLQVYAE